MHYEPYKALYLHIPFCVSKCAYCDFNSRACESFEPEIDLYVDNLVLDIRRASKEGLLAEIETVYLGGGTPSHIGIKRLSKVLYTLSVSMHLSPETECTMEANPESFDERMAKDLWALGVNRLSIGVQSFDDEVLKTLSRPHTAQDAVRAIQAAQCRFDNISIDLMCGIPGQSAESLRKSLNTAIDLGVKHVSVYPLTIEEHTLFGRMLDQGLMNDVDEDIEALHMKIAEDVLTNHGFVRYEVASYAKPGFESRHNRAYWTGLPYLGLGEGATSMRQTAESRERLCNGKLVERLRADEAMAEDLMLGMRMSQGISLEDINMASVVFPRLPHLIEELKELDLIHICDNRAKPTELGWLCGNELYGRFYELSSD